LTVSTTSARRRETGPGLRRRAAALLAAALLAAAGCAAPRYVSREVDKGQAAITRGISDVVEAADRAFGEPIVTDRERSFQAKIGGEVQARENNETKFRAPVTLRAPLPALQRRANAFIEIGSVADTLSSTPEAAAALDSNKSFVAAMITRLTEDVHLGVKLYGFWTDGPQLGVWPFLRWEWLRDPYRVLVEQQVYDRTDRGLGERTTLQLNRVFSGTSFVRWVSTVELNQHDRGTIYEHALIYRRLFPSRELVLSAQLGVHHNPYLGDPTAKTPGAQHDPDEAFFQLQATGKIYRPWLEYELTPAVHAPWNHADTLEFGVTFALRFVYESFLQGPEGGPPAATPSPQPNF
jgi:hypothetical protein